SMTLHENTISSAQLVGLDPVVKTSEHRNSRHGTTQVMVFTGPELADTMNRAIQASVERSFHQLHIGVREIAGIPDLFIEQSLGGVIVWEGRRHPAWQRRD